MVAVAAGLARSGAMVMLVGGATSLVVPTVAAAQDDRALAVLYEAGARYEGVETLCADFSQRLEIPLLGDERTGSGRMCQASPNLFAMRFTDPERDLIVVDGESVWVYFPSTDPKQVLRASADHSAGGRDFHREFLVAPESKYDVTYEALEDLAGGRAHRIRMIPKGGAAYRAAVVWIDRTEPILRQVRIEEENGSVRTITLTNVRFDAAPGAGWFRFTPPPGALVISG
jgi:outer membrane lipoprotein-sorting protein